MKKLQRADPPAISPDGTISKRHFAAIADQLILIALVVAVGKSLPSDWYVAHVAAAVATIVAYFFCFEAFFARTPGKFLNGLIVLDYDGGPCTAKQVAIRTAFRFLEVNPFLFGALPAAICIISTPSRQRIGDQVAGTIVVRT